MSNERLSRRRFFKLGAAVAAAVALPKLVETEQAPLPAESFPQTAFVEAWDRQWSMVAMDPGMEDDFAILITTRDDWNVMQYGYAPMVFGDFYCNHTQRFA